MGFQRALQSRRPFAGEIDRRQERLLRPLQEPRTKADADELRTDFHTQFTQLQQRAFGGFDVIPHAPIDVDQFGTRLFMCGEFTYRGQPALDASSDAADTRRFPLHHKAVVQTQ
ncbi:hypothetical protein ACHMW6_10085 [Pseudoduganella sp. UC29_106]|uniref:hypothetical protein n=1 Tax=Pseudoduganella sp. UC29_106 TaxID=3374553 RepID=UPI003757D08B